MSCPAVISVIAAALLVPLAEVMEGCSMQTKIKTAFATNGRKEVILAAIGSGLFHYLASEVQSFTHHLQVETVLYIIIYQLATI